ncbi:MAG: sialate O-acetylesterase [Rikenellaceae bacterium]
MKKLLISLLFIGSSLFSAQAEVKLPAILSDNMVLQQQSEVLLWGWSDSGKKVDVTTSWNGESYSTKVGNDGKWSLHVTTPEASNIPYSITFNDGDKLELHDILIGEVWFCSGQSNMEMPVRGNLNQPVLEGTDYITLAKQKTPIRMFSIAKNPQFTEQDDCKGRWEMNTPDVVADFSAVAYFFGHHLQSALDIPIGLINSSWGGSKIESWMSEDMLEKFPDVDQTATKSSVMPKEPNREPKFLYNGMIHPILGYKFKGMLWYQGCANRPNREQHEELMPEFVNTLRKKFDCGEFPLYFAQLAPLGYGGGPFFNVSMRESQVKIKNKISNCQIVIQTDIGEPLSIHPRFKVTTGKRFAYLALGDTYGMKGFDYLSPEYDKMKIVSAEKNFKHNSIHLSFKNAPNGINIKGFESKCFEIAGEDKIFYPAQAKLAKGDYPVIVWSEKVENPVAVRYAFKEYVEGDLYGHSELPVSSFRTDNWELPEK